MARRLSQALDQAIRSSTNLKSVSCNLPRRSDDTDSCGHVAQCISKRQVNPFEQSNKMMSLSARQGWPIRGLGNNTLRGNGANEGGASRSSSECLIYAVLRHLPHFVRTLPRQSHALPLNGGVVVTQNDRVDGAHRVSSNLGGVFGVPRAEHGLGTPLMAVKKLYSPRMRVLDVDVMKE